MSENNMIVMPDKSDHLSGMRDVVSVVLEETTGNWDAARSTASLLNQEACRVLVRSTVRTIMDEYIETNNQVYRLESVNEDLDNRIEQLEEELGLAQATIRRQHEIIDQLRVEVSEYSANGVARSAEIENLKRQLDIAQREIAEQHVQITRLTEPEQPKGKRQMTRACPSCNGTGKIKDPTGEMVCPGCGGAKRVSIEQWRALGGKNKPYGYRKGTKPAGNAKVY